MDAILGAKVIKCLKVKVYSHMYESNRTNWITVKIQSELVSEIDKAISKSLRLGVPRYRSRSDFVKEACLKLLESENLHTKLSSSNDKRKKLGEEEILVTRK